MAASRSGSGASEGRPKECSSLANPGRPGPPNQPNSLPSPCGKRKPPAATRNNNRPKSTLGGFRREVDLGMARLRSTSGALWSVDQVDFDVDITASRLRIGTGVVCSVDERFGDTAINARQTDVEAGLQEI